MPPPGKILIVSTECWQDIIDSSAASAWSDFPSIAGPLSGNAAFNTIYQLYFTLLKKLLPYSKRTLFTKQECMVLLSELSAAPIAARGSRKSAKALNEQLSERMAKAPAFQHAELQAMAKRCAARAQARSGS